MNPLKSYLRRILRHPEEQADCSVVHRARMVVHAGFGKCGSSAIQHVLKSLHQELHASDIYYLGMCMEHAPVRRHAWQKPSGAAQLFAMQAEERQAAILEIVDEVLAASDATAPLTLVWSNEVLAGRAAQLAGLFSALIARGIEVHVVLYVRKHDSWAVSAYKQWGVRHKTYSGKIKDFRKWIEERPARFFPAIESWSDIPGVRVDIRNYDEIPDTPSDFLTVIGVSAERQESTRVYESPATEELLLRAVMADTWSGTLLPHECTKLLFGSNSVPAIPTEEWLQHLLPTDQDLRSIRQSSEEDRILLDRLLDANAQSPVQRHAEEAPSVRIELEKVVGLLVRSLCYQACRIEALEALVKLKSTTGDASE